jgi:hypothetical protein
VVVVVVLCTWWYLSSSAIEGEEERETRNERVGKNQGASMYGRAMSNRSGPAEQHTVKLEQVPRWIEQERLSPTASSSLSDGGSDRDFLDPLTSGTIIPQSFSLFTSWRPALALPYLAGTCQAKQDPRSTKSCFVNPALILETLMQWIRTAKPTPTTWEDCCF